MHHFPIPIPKNLQQKLHSNHHLVTNINNSNTGSQFNMCRTSAINSLSNEFKWDIIRPCKPRHVKVSNNYYIEARFENYVTVSDLLAGRTEPSESIKAFHSFEIIPSYPVPPSYILQSYLDITKYVSATNIYGNSNEHMKFKTIHSIDSKTGQLYFHKQLKWLADKPIIYSTSNQSMDISTIKVITPRTIFTINDIGGIF